MKKVLLLILDGFGYSKNTKYNAIAKAKAPFLQSMYDHYPYSLLQTSGEAVGLPEGVMGNSEVGHLTIGAGRIIYQDLTKINKHIQNHGFNQLPLLDSLSEKCKTIHLMGLVSDGGVHSHEDHLHALVDYFSKRSNRVWIHVISDGRDTSPSSGKSFVEKLEKKIAGLSHIRIASLCGRYFAMDRDKRWDRTEKAYTNLISAQSSQFPSAVAAIQDAYSKSETDEFIQPRQVTGYNGMSQEDGLVFFNFRADRARQISQALAIPSFKEFSTPLKLKETNYLCFTSYSEDFNFPILFPKQGLQNNIGELVSKQGLKQLRIAETEKYAHVTYFFSGGQEEVFQGEDRILVDSPRDVATYDLKPEMSAPEVTEKLCAAISSNQYQFVVCNYANGDMVGHTGVESAAIRAVETLETCVKKVLETAKQNQYEVFLTADHGNVEEMYDEAGGEAMTQHSMNPVPFVWLTAKMPLKIKDGGLADIAPTLLSVMGMKKPDEMDGKSLID